MRFQKLDLNLLYALDVLLVEQNITRAAKVLHLSQSSTSSILARLREYFEDELLVYVDRKMMPTAMALSLQEPVHELLLKIRSTLEIRPQFEAAACTRHFRLIASDYTTSVLLDDIVKRLATEAPKVVLEILHPSIPATEELLRGKADLMFLPDSYSPPAIPSEELLQDSFSCIVCAENPEVGDSLSQEHFLSMGHVITRFAGSVTTHPDEFLEKAGYTLHNEIIVGNFSNLALMVMGTRRCAVIHTRLAYKLAMFYPIRVLPVPLQIPDIRLLMLWHPFLAKDPAHLWLRSIVRDAVARTEVLAAPAAKAA